jgi:hypothetical protein
MSGFARPPLVRHKWCSRRTDMGLIPTGTLHPAVMARNSPPSRYNKTFPTVTTSSPLGPQAVAAHRSAGRTTHPEPAIDYVRNDETKSEIVRKKSNCPPEALDSKPRHETAGSDKRPPVSAP